MANTDIIKKVTGIADEDLVYVTYQDDIKRKPFYVALDHKHKSVVVSVRGSKGKFDWLTNFTLVESDDLPLDQCGGVAGVTTHKGMLEAARDLKARLVGEEDECFERGLLARAWRMLGERFGPKAAQEYTLVLTGHSLGGGLAAILAILLKQDYPDLRCFAFAAPGCSMSAQAAEYCSPFVVSVLLGDDIVGRACLHSGYTLKIALLKVLREDPRKAYQNFFKSSKKLKEQIDQIDELIADCVTKMNERVRMYIPGCIMYIEEIVSDKKKTFEQYFCHREEAILNEIILSQHVISHHVAWRLLEGLEFLSDPPVDDSIEDQDKIVQEVTIEITSSDTKANASSSDTKANVASSDIKAHAVFSNTKANAAFSDTKANASSSDTKAHAALSNTKAHTASSDTKVHAASSDTKANASSSDTKANAASSDTKANAASSDTKHNVDNGVLNIGMALSNPLGFDSKRHANTDNHSFHSELDISKPLKFGELVSNVDAKMG